MTMPKPTLRATATGRPASLLDLALFAVVLVLPLVMFG